MCSCFVQGTAVAKRVDGARSECLLGRLNEQTEV